MSRGSRMIKRRNRIYRRIAVALTVALLVGQSHAFVLAEEDAGDVPTTEISGETATDASDNDNTGDNDNDTDKDDKNNGDTDDKNIEDNTEANGTENDEGDDRQEDEDTDGQDVCVCETKCVADSVNIDCLVCVADYNVCTGKEVEEILEETVSGSDLPAEVEEDARAYALFYTFTYNGIEYMEVDSGEVQVNSQNANLINGDIEIPEEVSDSNNRTYRVTRVGPSAFQRCSGLRSIKLPDSIMMINQKAFYNCSSLESIEIPNRVTEIEWNVFEGCTGLKSVRLPDGLTTIGDAAFKNCRNLSDIEIPNSVTCIERAAFSSCTSLGSATGGTIEIPNSVTTIEMSAFWGCTSLTSIIIPDSIRRIYSYAFRDCSNLSNVEIPNSVIEISNDAFEKCSSLRGIEIPNSVTEIGSHAFAECKSLESIKIPDKVTKIEVHTFSKCDNLQLVVLPDGITTIGEFAFEMCGSLGSFKLPKSVTSIQRGAFRNCTSLNELRIVIPSDGEFNPIEIGAPNRPGEEVFAAAPNDRSIVFLAEDGSELTGPLLEKAKRAYLDAGKNDDDPDDGKWYGWYVGELSGEADTYTVTIHVYKDTVLWDDHDRTFALKEDGSTEFIFDLNYVPNGTYNIYDITAVPVDSIWSKARDTGINVQVDGVDTEVDVTVENANAEAKVNYYTATFYDGVNNPYETATPQRPQIVLDGKQVAEPEAPSKTGYLFNGWVTENGGSTSFDFDTKIKAKTSIYVSWREDDSVVPPYIVAWAGAGGTIDPIGRIHVDEGADQTFKVIPASGYQIKSVEVVEIKDGIEVGREDVTTSVKARDNSYTFKDVRENHRIEATFVKADGSNPGGDGGNSGSGDGDHSDSGNGDHGNSDSGNGDSGNGDAGNSGGGDNAGGGNSDVSNISAGSVAAGGNAAAGSNSDGAVSGGSTGSKEPKTGDASQAEIYATIAMIAGLTYLILYFIEEGRGMSEQEKDELVAAFVRWAKKGGAFRRCCAMVAIFCILAYYHSIGKRIGGNALNEKYLGQLS